MESISVKVPASTANVGPGYDVFGIALTLYNTVRIEKAEKDQIIITGPNVDNSLPLDKTNLVFQAIETFYKLIEKPRPQLKISVDCQIPLASGLGSSSTAIVGGLAAANKLEGDFLSKNDLLNLAWDIEGHPDNVAPAILGGFIISMITPENKIAYKKLLWPDEWKLIICHPKFKLSTQKAREILPKEIPIKDAIFNMGCCSFLVSAISTKDIEILKLALNDKLHQPYRSKLVPGLVEISNELKKFNILGTVLSGAGPSICVITQNDDSEPIVEKVKLIWQNEGIDSEFFFPGVDNAGLHYS